MREGCKIKHHHSIGRPMRIVRDLCDLNVVISKVHAAHNLLHTFEHLNTSSAHVPGIDCM